METDNSLEAKRSQYPLVGFVVALGALVLIVIGSSIEAVTVDRFPIRFSLSVGEVSSGARVIVVTLVVIAAAALVVARATARPRLALVTTAACALTLPFALYLLSKATNPSGLVGDAVDLADPRPGVGFYLIVAGGILGVLGSLAVALAGRD